MSCVYNNDSSVACCLWLFLFVFLSIGLVVRFVGLSLLGGLWSLVDFSVDLVFGWLMYWIVGLCFLVVGPLVGLLVVVFLYWFDGYLSLDCWLICWLTCLAGLRLFNFRLL